MIDDVRVFHRKFGQLDPDRITHLTRRKLAERVNFMLEELTEFAHGCGLLLYIESVDPDGPAGDQDMELQADALVDLVYVALGTAAMMGLGAAWADLWDDVQRANMAKVKGPTHRNMGFGSDICKPPGWRGPETGVVLNRHGYDRVVFEDDDGAVDDAKCLDDEGVKKMFTKSEE